MCNEQPLKEQKKNRSFRYTEYNWMHLDVSLVGNSTNSQKGVASLSCGRELRCDILSPARIESWRESHHNNNPFTDIQAQMLFL